MKASIVDIERRIVLKKDRTKGIIQYDLDNAYPQRVEEIIAASGIATICVDYLSKFIEGMGFKTETLNKSKPNPKMTMKQLLRVTVQDFAKWNGFALHLNYNGMLEVSSVQFVPFEFVRLPSEDNADHPGQFAVYDNWDRSQKDRVEREKIKWVHAWHPNKDITAKQIENAGGIDKYNGQVFYFSKQIDTYPKSTIDAELETAMTDAEIKDFHFNNITTNFMASHIFIYKGKFEDDTERDEFNETLESFQGAKKASKILVIDDVDEDSVPEVIKMEIADNGDLFATTEQSAKERIRRLYGIPNVLIEAIPGALGQNDQMAMAYNYMNTMTRRERAVFEESFQEIFSNFHTPIGPDFTIKPLELNVPTPSPES